MSTSPVLGASVGELLDQAEAQLYSLATGTPSGNRLLAAWPQYATACARLTTAAAGPRAAGHAAVSRRPDADPVLLAGLRLEVHIGVTVIATNGVLPDQRITRAAQLIGAAADLIECAHDRPGVAQREAAQADNSRSAGIIRAAELTLAGADLTLRACGRSHQQSPTAAPNTPARLTSRATPVFETRRLAAKVLDAAAGRPGRSDLDDVRVPAVGAPRPGDLLDHLHVALAGWRTASLGTAQSPAPSSAEMQRASVEARHLIALTAALTDSARATGAMSAADATLAMVRLQQAGAAWSAVTTAWTHFTTGVPPSQDHVSASLHLQSAIRDIGRSDDGAWLAPAALAERVALPAAFDAARSGLGDVLDVSRAHAEAASFMVKRGSVFAHANTLPLTDARVEARVRGRHVPVTADEAPGLRHAYGAVLHGSETAHRQVSVVAPVGIRVGNASRPNEAVPLGTSAVRC